MNTHRTHITFIIACLIGLPAHLCAQAQHDFSLGAHGGVSMYLTDGGLRNLTSGAGGLDLTYTVRGEIARQTALGVKLGAGITFANAKHALSDYTEQYTNIDYYPSIMDYTVTAATYTEQQMQLQLEVPLLLSFVSHGLTINLGGKFMMPFYQQRKIDVTDAHIAVYYEDFWVSVIDYQATGCLPDHEYHGKENGSFMPRFNALLAAEIGYEWQVGRKNRMGILAYLDYSLWNNYTNTPPCQRAIDVAPITNREYPVPDIRVNALTGTYASKANYLSGGIKLYYAFHHKSRKKYPCLCERN